MTLRVHIEMQVKLLFCSAARPRLATRTETLAKAPVANDVAVQGVYSTDA